MARASVASVVNSNVRMEVTVAKTSGDSLAGRFPWAARVNPGRPVWLAGPIRCGRRRAGGPPELAV